MPKRFIISGGGTGGHIFPAVSIAGALRARYPDCEILFVGANGRMEMQRVPEAGYSIVGLDVRGIERKNLLKNFSVIFDFIKSCIKAKQIVREFAPDVAIGVGGYVSGAAMWAASSLGVPVVLQEQNSFAGLTNRFLAKRASAICVAYDKMERFFPADRIFKTGNPVRQNILNNDINKEEAYQYFSLDKNKKTLLVIGGSLGAKTINQSLLSAIDELQSSPFQIIWQTGRQYFPSIKEEFYSRGLNKIADCKPIIYSNMYVSDFISRMDYAYSVADVVISRAGASSISELSILGKPSILVPSPNVAENHQFHNAMALKQEKAAVLVEDHEASSKLITEALTLLADIERQVTFSKNIKKMAFEESAEKIVDTISKFIQ